MAGIGSAETSADTITRLQTAPLFLSLTNELSNDVAKQVLRFAYSACRLDGDALGWMPKLAYDRRHTSGNMLALWNNDDLVGFVMFAHRSTECKIYQIWVRNDARQIMHGRALIDDLEARAQKAGCLRIRLWCAEDLPANLFWKCLHFHYVTWRYGRRTAKRRHVLWIRTCHPQQRAQPSSSTPPTDARVPSTLRMFLPRHVEAD